jgi:hypothetical protein
MVALILERSAHTREIVAAAANKWAELNFCFLDFCKKWKKEVGLLLPMLRTVPPGPPARRVLFSLNTTQLQTSRVILSAKLGRKRKSEVKHPEMKQRMQLRKVCHCFLFFKHAWRGFANADRLCF